jgi:type II secretory pathway pseudopilin PulG
VNRSNIRSVGIFALVAILLAAVVIGGVRFAKNRDATYASQHKAQTQHDTAQAGTGTKNPTSPPASPNPHPSTGQNQKISPTPQPSPVAVVPTPKPAPTPQSSPTATPTPSPSSTQPAQKVPSTGPTDEFFVTASLIMVAMYLGIFIHKNRLTYKRLLS